MMERLLKVNMDFHDITDNYNDILARIETAKKKANRTDKVHLMAVTKTVSTDKINHAISLGIDLIGENRVQELMSKYEELDINQDISVQIIGSLQTNKVKYICDKVSMIQSVDSIKLASEINRQCEKISKTMDILLQVNIGREESKGGFLVESLDKAIFELSDMKNIRLRGLMAIPPIGEGEKYFPEMHKIYVDIGTKKVDNSNKNNILWDTLSMGMSDDFELAIQHGANLVRVGSLLFGKRDYLTLNSK